MPEQPTGPTYRFWGTRDPRGRSKPELVVKNTADVVADDEGVVTMRIYDPIDSWGGDFGVSASEFAKALDSLSDDTSEIRLHINSPGGEVYEGLAILNQLRNHKARVVAIVDGIAASAASFIATGADEVVMGRNTQMMVHDAFGLCVGPAIDMRAMADMLDKVSDNVASIYAAKVPEADWRAAMLAETWFDADEAVTVGLADRVEGAPADSAKNKFDLSIFAHNGREDAPTPSLLVAENPEPAVVDPEPVPVAASAYQTRRHRMNAHRHGLPL